MNKILTFACAALTLSGGALADSDKQFRDEIKRGLPVASGYSATSAQTEIYTVDMIVAEGYGDVGDLGREVFYDEPEVENSDYHIFVPTSHYLRMGGGMNIAGVTRHARVGDVKHRTRDSWNFTLGMGWNLSSYVRGELNFQESMFKFHDVSELNADYYTINGMFYFDLVRRYVRTGDVTYRRNFVPFIGVGAGLGLYDFAGPDGAKGFMVVAPRAELGMNFMLTDLIGLDIAYQYQMIIGHGFGWQTHRIGVDNIGNVMATFRVNF